MLNRTLVGLTLALASVTVAESRPLPPAPTPAAVATAADFVADVVGPYLAIQTALVNDDLGPVAAAAAQLQKSAGALGADGASLAGAAAKTAGAKTMEAARAAFGDLSAELIAYADKTKQPVAGKIIAFCPMVNKSWVQADGAIANPYYGKAMSTCGSSTRKL